MKIPSRVSKSPNTYKASLKLRAQPSWAAKKVTGLLEKKGYKRSTTDTYALDLRYEFEHALRNLTGGPGYIYDIVVYGRDYARLYIELDGPDHDSSRDEEKETRAKRAQAQFLRLSFKKKGGCLKHNDKRLSDEELIDLIESRLYES